MPEVVFVRGVVAMPGDHVQRRVRDLRPPERSAPFDEQLTRGIAVLVGRRGREEVAGIGETIGADRAALGKRERATVILADIAARGTIWQFDAELHPTRD